MEVEELNKSDYDDSVINDDQYHVDVDLDGTIKLLEAPKEETQPEPQTEEEMRNCKHCNFQAEDWPAFAAHVLKPSHVKKVAETMKVRVPLDPMFNHLYCDMCSVTCAGHVPWNAHLMGAKHRKAKEGLARVRAEDSWMPNNSSGGPMRNNQFGNTHNTTPYDRPKNIVQQPPSGSTQSKADEYSFANYPQPLLGLEFVTETEELTGKIKRYHCSLCNSKFDHNLRFPHLVGQKHRLHVLKLKRPECVKNLGNLKSSEISAICEKEATKFEQEEGRKQPILYSPENSTGRNSRGRGTNRGGRGVQRGTTGNNRGSTWSNRGSTGVARAGRGNSGFTSRGSRGMSGTRGNSRGQNRGRTVGQHSGGDYYTNEYNSYGNDSYGTDLPYNSGYSENFDSADYRRNNQQSYGSEKSYYDSGQFYPTNRQPYSGGSGQSYSGSGLPYSGSSGQSYSGSGLPYTESSGQSYSGSGQPYYGGSGQSYSDSGRQSPYYGGSGQSYSGSGQSYSGGGQSSYYGTSEQSYEHFESQNWPSSESDTRRPKMKTGISSSLAAALGDLEKLVQSDDDVSVALQVSNALTNALFKYRVKGQE